MRQLTRLYTSEERPY